MMLWLILAALAGLAAVGVTARVKTEPPAGQGAPRWALAAIPAAVFAAAFGLYALVGRPELATAPRPAPPSAAPAQLAGLTAALEAKMARAPDDPRGWRLLGWSYGRLGRWADSASAWAAAARLDPADGDALSAQGEALTQAAGGQVTPDAAAAFAAALTRAPGDPRARYYLALAKDQRGDAAGALADLRALIAAAPDGAPWLGAVRAAAARLAR